MTSRLEGFFAASLALSSCVDSGQETFTPEDAMQTRDDIDDVFAELNHTYQLHLENFESPSEAKMRDELDYLEDLDKIIKEHLEFLELSAIVSPFRKESDLDKKTQELLGLINEVIQRAKILLENEEVLISPYYSQKVEGLIDSAREVKVIVEITQKTKIYPESL